MATAQGWYAGLVLLMALAATASLEGLAEPEVATAGRAAELDGELVESNTVLLSEDITEMADARLETGGKAPFVSELDTKKESQEAKSKSDEGAYKSSEASRIANEKASKSSVAQALQAALASGDASAIAAEAASKKQALELKAEQAIEDEHEAVNKKSYEAYESIFNDTKKEIKNKFNQNVEKIEKTSRHAGIQMMESAREVGRKAFLSDEERRESRIKVHAKAAKDKKAAHKAQMEKLSHVLKYEGSQKATIKQFEMKEKQKAQTAKELNDKLMAMPYFKEKMALENMQTKNEIIQAKIEEGKVPPAMGTPNSASPETKALIKKLNEVVAGMASDEKLKKAELAAGVTRAPTPPPKPPPYNPVTQNPDGSSKVDQNKVDQETINTAPVDTSTLTTQEIPQNVVSIESEYKDAVNDLKTNYPEHAGGHSVEVGETLHVSRNSKLATLDSSNQHVYNPLAPQKRETQV